MSNHPSSWGFPRRATLGVVVTGIAFLGMVPVAAPAGAAPVAAPAAVTCPTVDYTGVTAPCQTSTTAPVTTPVDCPASPLLSVSYTPGTLTWIAYDYPSLAVGSTTTLYLNGSIVSSAPVAGNCSTTGPPALAQVRSVRGTNSVSLCLNPGTYTGVAVDQGFNDTNPVTFTVPGGTPPCATPTGPILTQTPVANPSVATPSVAKTTPSGTLAFTGANVLRLLLLALLLLAIGVAITLATRRRQHTD